MRLHRRATGDTNSVGMVTRRVAAAIARCRTLPLRYTLGRSMTTSGDQRPAFTVVVVCADFDQTITTRDTIALLFDAANAKRTNTTDRATHKRQVQQLVDQYVHEYAQLTASALDETAGGRYFDEKELLTFLEAFAKVDRQSIQRVIESGTLKGLERRDLEKIGENVEVMEKSIETLGLASSATVISSNWSHTMICERLRRSGLNVAVVANELRMDESGVTTGGMDLVVQSPADKATLVRSQQVSDDALIIFIGDSTNDLLAMLQADIGITLGFAAESTLGQVCRRYGIELSPLSHFDDLLRCKDHAKTKARSNQRVLFTANSWSEIHSVMLATTVG